MSSVSRNADTQNYSLEIKFILDSQCKWLKRTERLKISKMKVRKMCKLNLKEKTAWNRFSTPWTWRLCYHSAIKYSIKISKRFFFIFFFVLNSSECKIWKMYLCKLLNCTFWYAAFLCQISQKTHLHTLNILVSNRKPSFVMEIVKSYWT